MLELELPNVAWRRPDRALLRVRRQLAVVGIAVPGALGALALAVLVEPAAGVAALAIAGLLTALALISVERQWAAWGYFEREDDLLVRRGVLLARTSVVPYGRMQYVDVAAGPLDRRLGLATVTLHTAAAAADVSVPGLATAEAERLRDRLAALGEARQAGV